MYNVRRILYSTSAVETKMHYLFNTAGLVCRVYIFSVFRKQFEALQKKNQRIFVRAGNETTIPSLTQQILF